MKNRLISLLICTLCFAAAGCRESPGKMTKDLETAFERGRTLGGIREFRLRSNGLRVLLMEDHSAPVAAVMMIYEAGSRDESQGATGAAHMLEHMMFKGTAEYHKKFGTHPAKLLEAAGAEINASTQYDSTQYYAFLPSDKVSLALDIEAARMRGALLDAADFASEKTVIQNELERYFDSPEAALYNAVWQTAFRVHPYGHPVIGWREDVAGMTVESLRLFYDRYYAPDNAVLTVAGSFQTSSMLAEIAARYGGLQNPPRESLRAMPEEPEQTEKRSVEIQRPEGAQYLMAAFRIPGAAHPDRAALDLLSAVLGSGKTSRFYQKLVHSGMAGSVDVSASETRDPGLMTITVTLAGASHQQAENAVLEVLEELQKNGVSQEELDRALNQTRSALAFSRDGAFSSAAQIAQAVSMGDWTSYASYLDRAERVSKEDLHRAAKTYFKTESLTQGRLLTGARGQSGEAAVSGLSKTGTVGEHSAQGEDMQKAAKPKEPSPRIRSLLDSLGQIEENTSYGSGVKSLDVSGIRVLVFRTQVRGVVSFSGSMPRGGTAYSHNPVLAKLTAQMIDKGTVGRTSLEIPKLLEDRGAEIYFGNDSEYVRFQGRCLKKDTALVLELAAEQLRAPSFLQAEFDKLKERERVGLKQAMSSTSARAVNALLRGIFPEGHPLRPASLEQHLEALNATNLEDVQRFHRDHYGSQGVILSAAGDVDDREAAAAVKKAFEGWAPRHVSAAPVPAVEVPRQIVWETVRVPGKQNADIVMGHSVPLTRLDKDFAAISVSNAVLGGDFTSRLSSSVRDHYGLTYGIRSGLVGMNDRLTGAWIIHLIVNTPVLREGLVRTFEEMKLFREQGITERELREKKESLTGQFKTGLASTQALADQILKAQELGVGPAYLDRLPNLIREVTLTQAQETIRRYFKPESMIVVAAGTPSSDEAGFDFPKSTS